MTPADFVKYGDGLLLILMYGFLLIIAIGMALESVWHWIERAIIMRWRAWRGNDPDDKDHA